MYMVTRCDVNDREYTLTLITLTATVRGRVENKGHPRWYNELCCYGTGSN